MVIEQTKLKLIDILKALHLHHPKNYEQVFLNRTSVFSHHHIVEFYCPSRNVAYVQYYTPEFLIRKPAFVKHRTSESLSDLRISESSLLKNKS